MHAQISFNVSNRLNPINIVMLLSLLHACRYGVGIAAGISVVGWLKRKIKQLPVVGLLASPCLSKFFDLTAGSCYCQ